jgi:hypothetical protein
MPDNCTNARASFFDHEVVAELQQLMAGRKSKHCFFFPEKKKRESRGDC